MGAVEASGEFCIWTRILDHQVLGEFPRDIGPTALAQNVEEAVEEDGVLRVGTEESYVDLFYLPHRLEDFETVWKRSIDLDGCLRKLCIEDLIESKLETGRRQDDEDVRFLKSLKLN
jgi:hypothetical protein